MKDQIYILLVGGLFLVEIYAHSRPNIIYLLVDDLGYNDVGYHDCTIDSPVITQLASEGIIIENNYVAPICGPSRAALLTGRYNFRVGYQHGNPERGSPTCLTKENPILPEVMKTLGYNTYMLGKWQMGFCNEDCAPTYRGFDKFYGFYSGEEDHYTHKSDVFYDFYDDVEVDTCVYGQYSGDLLRDRARKYIDTHVTGNTTKDNPFFMYFAFHNVHAPFQAPERYIQMHISEENMDHRLLKAMISFTDDTIGDLVENLKHHDIYDNTIIIFSSDNGGPSMSGMPRNSPLRGTKSTVWEGGVRVPGFVHSPLLKASAGSVSYELFHQTDWFPTIISLAGGRVPDYVDGYDQTDMVINGRASMRSVIPIHYDNYDPPTQGRFAIRVGKWKLIKGFVGRYDGYDSIAVGPDALHPTYDDDSSLISNAASAENQILLFDLESDPIESFNLADAYPDIVSNLERILGEYGDTAVELDPRFLKNSPVSPQSYPELYGGVKSTGWC